MEKENINIFENANAGDVYLSVNNNQFVYIAKRTEVDYNIHFLCDVSSVSIKIFLDNGKETIFEGMPMDNSINNIVSRYYPSIEKDEVEKLAYDYAMDEFGKEHYPEFGEIMRNYISGYIARNYK